MPAPKTFRLAAGLPLLALAAAGCATLPRYRAAEDVHAFLVAVRDGDRARFEAHVDRPALTMQLRSRLIAEADRRDHGRTGLAMAAAALAAPLAGVAVDVAVRPDTFRAEALRLGYAPDRPLPPTLAIAALVRPLGDGRACVPDRRGGPCVLSFDESGGVWRLAGFEGPLDLAGLHLPATAARRGTR